jgi:hypothetical protein
MDLLELLKVNRDWLPRESWKAVSLCGRTWDQLGCPTTPAALINFLDQALKSCVQFEVQYPKIFLKRLKQLQRGEWSPYSYVRERNCADRAGTYVP